MNQNVIKRTRRHFKACECRIHCDPITFVETGNVSCSVTAFCATSHTNLTTGSCFSRSTKTLSFCYCMTTFFHCSSQDTQAESGCKWEYLSSAPPPPVGHPAQNHLSSSADWVQNANGLTPWRFLHQITFPKLLLLNQIRLPYITGRHLCCEVRQPVQYLNDMSMNHFYIYFVHVDVAFIDHISYCVVFFPHWGASYSDDWWKCSGSHIHT